MKLNSMEELFTFNALLDQCRGQVWLMSPTGKMYDLTNGDARLKGLAALAGDNSDEYELYTRMREDEGLLMRYLRDRAA